MSDEVRPAYWEILRRQRRVLDLLLSSRWWPHAPLGAMVLVNGLFRLMPSLEGLLGLSIFQPELKAASMDFLPFIVGGFGGFAIGMLLIAISAGLFLRSRFAWVVALIAIGATIVVEILMDAWRDHVPRVVYGSVVITLLLIYRKRFSRSSLTSASVFGITSMTLVLAYSVMGSFELGSHFRPAIADVVDAFYFSMVSITTVGYGDIVPVTRDARLFTASVITSGVIVFSVSLSAILVPLMLDRVNQAFHGRVERMDRANHYILVGNSALARNTYKELCDRKETVCVILPDGSTHPMFATSDIVHGDGAQIATLEAADAGRAKAILALGDDDSENAFVVLAAKEIKGSARTVVGVNQAANLARLKRVQPDLLIAPQIIGGEILARALTGEGLDGSDLLSGLFVAPNSDPDEPPASNHPER